MSVLVCLIRANCTNKVIWQVVGDVLVNVLESKAIHLYTSQESRYKASAMSRRVMRCTVILKRPNASYLHSWVNAENFNILEAHGLEFLKFVVYIQNENPTGFDAIAPLGHSFSSFRWSDTSCRCLSCLRQHPTYKSCSSSNSFN